MFVFIVLFDVVVALVDAAGLLVGGGGGVSVDSVDLLVKDFYLFMLMAFLEIVFVSFLMLLEFLLMFFFVDVPF